MCLKLNFVFDSPASHIIIAMNEVKKQSPVHSSWLIVAVDYVDLRSRNDAFFFFRHHDEYTTSRRHCDERSEEAISCSLAQPLLRVRNDAFLHTSL